MEHANLQTHLHTVKIKQLVLAGYAAIGLVVALYGSFLGDAAHRGFAYHLGQGLVWPAVLLPGIGKFIGGIVIVLVITALLARRK